MTDLLGDRVCLHQSQLCIYLNVHDDMQCASDPACAYVGNFLYARNFTGGSDDGGNDTWINGIKETLQDATRGGIHDSEDHNGDDKTSNGIGQPQVEEVDTDEAEKSCQGGQSVNAGV